MEKRTTWPNIPRARSVPEKDGLLRFDGAHSPIRGYATRFHGFSLEAKIPSPAPTLLSYGTNWEEFPRVPEERPVPRAFRIADGETDRARAAREAPKPLVITETLLASAGAEVVIRRLILPQGEVTPITEYTEHDQVWYIHRGQGYCHSDIGSFPFYAGDYCYVPKGFLSSFESEISVTMIGTFAQAGFERPNTSPILHHNALREPYNEFDLRIPDPQKDFAPAQAYAWWFDKERQSWPVDHVRGRTRYRAYYDQIPLGCLGYQGTPYPFALPVSSVIVATTPQVHTDPYWFTTFLAADHSVAVSTFKERRAHSLPYYHKNTYDEFLFLADGYEARKGSGVGAGDAVFHPQGFTHGPQPEALAEYTGAAEGRSQPWVNERAIMFESRLALFRPSANGMPLDSELTGYWRTWQTKRS